MKPDLADLQIGAREIEQLTGLEVNEMFIGGVLGGTYRPSLFKKTSRLMAFSLTQLFVSALTFIFTLPVGLWLIRSSAGVIRDWPTMLSFLLVTLETTVIAIAGWNIYMAFRVRSFKTLAHLLDEVDRYNDVIRAVDVLDKLEEVGNPQASVRNREQLLEALNITRKSLVCGLMTERILRQHRKLLARRYELFSNIENNLTALKTLEIRNQASEYAEFLNHTLQIGVTVQQEVQGIVGKNDFNDA